jgi:DNA processing protein
METSVTEDIVYLATLNRLKGIGPQSVLRIIEIFPTANTLHQASSLEWEEKLGQKLAHTLSQSIDHWVDTWSTVQESLQRYIEKKVIPIPITSEAYPPLLRLIIDPPIILYAKGNIELLKHPQTIAIIGTREPTQQGVQVAHYLARQWVHYNYVIVSGLAKGIDTAAHEGTLDAKGKTIAVLGTPLDKIYPAENKGLAEQILDAGGLLLSEMLLGQSSFKTAFVRRDRIQSGLSLCVFPVQTRLDGGTMHTIHFAKEQKRYVFCPRPAVAEEQAKQYEGIWFLIREKHVPCFTIDRDRNYEIFQQTFQTLLGHLLGEKALSVKADDRTTRLAGVQGKPASLWDMAEQEFKTENR